MSAGYCPLSLEFVSVCIVYKNNIKLGLREKVTSVNDGGPMELSEEVVDEFMENSYQCRLDSQSFEPNPQKEVRKIIII